MEAKDDRGEGKDSKEEKGGDSVPLVDVLRIDIDSSMQPLTSQLDLEVDFSVDRGVLDAVWEIKVWF